MKRFFYLSVILISLFTSCRDEAETQAQLAAKKLKADIGSGNASFQTISVLSIYDSSAILVGSSYVINSDGFIVITTNANQSTTFNLGELKSYLISLNSLTLYY